MAAPSLLDLYDGAAASPAASLTQGRDSAICFASRRQRSAFAERLLGAPGGRFEIGRWRCTPHLAARQFGLLSHRPYLLGRISVRDNLELARHAAPAGASVERCLAETGLLADLDLAQPAGALPWTRQVELNFVQLWLRAPQCLLIDHVFDSDDGAALLHLPALFRRRYPFRTICYLEQVGRLPPTLGVTHLIDIV